MSTEGHGEAGGLLAVGCTPVRGPPFRGCQSLQGVARRCRRRYGRVVPRRLDRGPSAQSREITSCGPSRNWVARIPLWTAGTTSRVRHAIGSGGPGEPLAPGVCAPRKRTSPSGRCSGDLLEVRRRGWRTAEGDGSITVQPAVGRQDSLLLRLALVPTLERADACFSPRRTPCKRRCVPVAAWFNRAANCYIGADRLPGTTV